jgi:tRNA (5-methylaminomethyl-2-thiouridylate)-methyltransferase
MWPYTVLFSLLLLLWGLLSTDSFLLQQPASHRPHHFDSANSRLSASSSQEDGNEEESIEVIQQRLVKYGMAWKQTPISPDMAKVPGCVANVYVLAKEESSPASSSEEEESIRIFGNSDAIISRGLMSLLNAFLSMRSKQDILELDPATITDQLRVRKALTTGRNDGIANMLQVIQQQLRDDVAMTHLDSAAAAAADDADDKQSVESSGKKKVALLLSGGVDSSVALHLLLKQGYDVTAFYLKIWLEDEVAHLGECPWEDDVHTCQQVCQQANVPLQIISLQEQYHERVMQHTLHEASQGRTPNPDILCNSRVKFGCFLEYLDSDRQGEFDFIASGHYAQLQRNDDDDNSPARLVRAPDAIKDQSYFLCALQQFQLQKLLFPIGHLEKYQVRELAEEFQLPNRHRPDSQGLCFLGKVKFSDFLNIHLGVEEGDIVDAFTGDIIGHHQGVWYHTVGQRKGIGKSLFPLATSQGPWYVVAKDPQKNVVFASNQYDQEVFAKARSEFHVENIQWIAGHPPETDGEDKKYQFDMKIRHGPRLVVGNVELLSNDDGIIQLTKKDGGLAPGQYVVFYDADDATCLGGGIISERHWAKFLLDAETRRSVEESTTTTSTSS